jgi:two-component system chemotaxis sensor kinase CheA
MKTRMQPIGNVWSKFPRMVRDLAAPAASRCDSRDDGKRDRTRPTIIEAIKDPADTHRPQLGGPRHRGAGGAHGRGQTRRGHCSEAPSTKAGQVNIEIADDGAGIDPERPPRKAVERGLVTPEQAARMSDREVCG